MPNSLLPIVPALVIEVRSPSDRTGRLRGKIREYLSSHVRLIWVVDPTESTVMVYRPNMQGLEYTEGQALDGYDVLPGFSLPVAELFA